MRENCWHQNLQGVVDKNPSKVLNVPFFFAGPIIYNCPFFCMELQMALSRRLLGHIHGNFTHMTTMTYIFMLTCQSTLLTWIFVFVLRPRSAREMGRMAMINVSLGSQSTRNFIWDENFWLLTCQETKIHVDFMKSSWILWFRRSSHYVWCEVSLDAEFPQLDITWYTWIL